ncbi:hypothetical protein C5B42_00850 [Candidatus Cerribacteria bacterium 'Amazon FNV 2010 28 9']|uniref:Glycosyltransferase RgtA/B/C/D-like domain-containing protein n=1 Tax=Candidatus Cerribacteria bacterium 'Amazon FNV 2010 28 9' TaxID=2081795 RepID=A0A317JQU1_9BACT|nr:MAG: hypothetical protein C5B42_00850 [Candidatus Cerribacteria bacterium 'Amazon FNV 2010 28 9']
MFSILWSKRLPVFLFALFIIGAFLRLYRIRPTMQFFGDQGRDALIARRILIEHHPALIGPQTSVGNMYLGPLYYYFMVIPLMMTYPDPVGPAIAVALIGIITNILLYVLGKEMVGKQAALIATILYTFSPIIITYTRFSWNPNIVPLFSLLTLWLLYKTWKGKRWYWAWIGVCVSILLQLHYITLVIAAFAGVVWLLEVAKMIRIKKVHVDFFIATAIAVVVFILSLIPLAAFDLRHNFLNLHAFENFFHGNESHFRSFSQISATFYAGIGLLIRTNFELFGVKLPNYTMVLVATIIVVLGGFSLLQKRKRQEKVGVMFVLSLFIFSLCILSFYTESIFDHYLAFLFPVASLSAGILLSYLWGKAIMKPFVIALLIVFVGFSLEKYPGTANLGLNVDYFKRSAQVISTHVNPGEAYDILVFSGTKDFDGMAYRYFLTIDHRPPVDVGYVQTADKLFLIDEQRQENVLASPQYDLAVWPNRIPTASFDIPNGPHVIELAR